MIKSLFVPVVKALPIALFVGCFLATVPLPAQTPDNQAQEAPPTPDLSQNPAPEPDALMQPQLEWDALETVPEAGPAPTPVPPEPVPAPEPESSPVPDPPIEPPTEGTDPNGPQIDKENSEVEVWRPESESPQMPARIGPDFDKAYVAGPEPVSLRLQFDPLGAGKIIQVYAGEGLTIVEPGSEVLLDSTGVGVIAVSLESAYPQSSLTVVCDGIESLVPIVAAPLALVVEKETETAGAQ